MLAFQPLLTYNLYFYSGAQPLILAAGESSGRLEPFSDGVDGLGEFWAFCPKRYSHPDEDSIVMCLSSFKVFSEISILGIF